MRDMGARRETEWPFKYFSSFFRSLQIIGTMHGREVRGGRDFGPEKCLKEYCMMCSVCFQNAIGPLYFPMKILVHFQIV